MSHKSLLAKSVMLALAVVLVAGSTSFGQNRQRQRGKKGQRQRGNQGQSQRGNQGQKQRGGQFGGRGGRLNQSTLLRAEQVQKELNLSEDQLSKINSLNESSRTNFREQSSGLRELSEEERRAKLEELREKSRKAAEETNKKLDGILTAVQSKRLGEIILQQQGFAALTTDKIGTTLNISASQKEQIEDLVSARREIEQELRSGLGDLSREERQEKSEELRTKQEELRTETDKAIQEVLTASQRSQFEQMKGGKFELDRRALSQGGGGIRGGRQGAGGGRPRAGGQPGDGNRRPGGNNGNRNRRPG